MKDISIDEFLDSIPNVDGINKEKIKKEYNKIEDPEKQLQYMQKLYDQAKARYEDLKARQSKEERAARTRRLIELGALVELVLGSDINHDYFRELLEDVKQLKNTDDQIYIRLGRAVEKELRREVNENDIQRFINFLVYQDRKGNYFIDYMNYNRYDIKQNNLADEE